MLPGVVPLLASASSLPSVPMYPVISFIFIFCSLALFLSRLDSAVVNTLLAVPLRFRNGRWATAS